ncbi:MAG: ABC transporter permease [Spirochaetia bacterium]
MKPWILFISARHFRTKRREKGHTASLLSVGGIAAGVMTLVTVLAVMNGFQIGTIEDILEINSYHLRVHTSDAAGNALLIADAKGVKSAIPFVEMYALAQGFFADPLAIAVRGVPAEVRTLDTGFADQLEIVAGTFDITTGRSIVVGQELARRIGLRVGDSLSVINFSAEGLNLARPDSMDLLVTGLFKTGFLEYDAGWAFVSLATTSELGGGTADTIGVKLLDRFSDRATMRRIDSAVPGVQTVSWRDYNRSIFGALRLEKTLMMLLVGLIFVVVAVNIYQSLRRSVVERTEEIGVLKALGASPASLQFVFVFEGLMIGLAGAVVGTALGLALSFNINAVFAGAEIVVNGILRAAGWIVGLFAPGRRGVTAGFTIFSPAYFYLDSVPATVIGGEVLGVALFALASAVVAAFAASRRISGIVPAEVLRYE